MDIQDVITEAGAYYKNGGQGVKDVLNRFRQRNETEGTFTDVAPTVDTKVVKANTRTTAVLQAFQKTWTPKGQTTFEIEPIYLFKIKADVEETPDDLEASWLGFLAGVDENDRTKWPFVRWWLENEIMPQMEEDFEMNLIYNGKYVAPTTGSPGGDFGGMDGMNVIINRHIANGKIAPIVMGVPPEDPVEFVDYMEDLAKQVPLKLQGKLEPWKMDRVYGRRFIDGMDLKYNKNYAQVQDKVRIHNTTMSIVTVKDPDSGLMDVGLRSMEGSSKIWTTVKGNSAVRTKNPAKQGVFKIEGSKRQVVAYTDFWKGCGVWIPEYTFCNNQDTAKV